MATQALDAARRVVRHAMTWFFLFMLAIGTAGTLNAMIYCWGGYPTGPERVFRLAANYGLQVPRVAGWSIAFLSVLVLIALRRSGLASSRTERSLLRVTFALCLAYELFYWVPILTCQETPVDARHPWACDMPQHRPFVEWYVVPYFFWFVLDPVLAISAVVQLRRMFERDAAGGVAAG